MRGARRPSLREWRSLGIIGLLMFSLTYGALFWGEQFVPSGITAVLESYTAVDDGAVGGFRAAPTKISLARASGRGGGVLWRDHYNANCDDVQRGGHSTFGAFGVVPCLVILGGSASWSLGAVLTRSLALPKSRLVTAGAEMMLGGVMLLMLSLLRESCILFLPFR